MNILTQKNIFRLLLFLNVIIVGIVFRVREYPAPEADYQTYIKLTVWVMSLGFCLFFYKSWLSKMFRADNLFLTVFLFVNLLSIFYSPLLYFSSAAIFTVFCVFIFSYAACDSLESKDVFGIVFSALSAICAVSIIFYFLYPEFARYREWHDGILTVGTRLCGVTGTANHMGFISAFALLVAYQMVQERYSKISPFFILLVVIDITALLMTNSRTSLAALLISLCIASFLRPSYEKLFFACLSGALLVAMLLFLDTQDIFSALARSGEAEEITSGTGRSDIWRVVLRLIEEKPFLGYGYASSLQILDAATSEVGFKAASTHNVALQILLNAGILSLFFFILAYSFKAYTAIVNKDAFIVAGLIFIMIIGLSESVSFQGVSNTSTLALALIFSSRYSKEMSYKVDYIS